MTEGWTGADLKGLVIEAELGKVRRGGEGELRLKEALEEVGPSITKRERERWEVVRRKWQGEKKAAEEDGEVEDNTVTAMGANSDGNDQLKERVALR